MTDHDNSAETGATEAAAPGPLSPPGSTANRRRVLAMAGGIGVAAAAATLLGDGAAAGGTRTASPTPHRTLSKLDCSTVLTPEEIEGPYYIDGEQMRSDITEGKPGIPVNLQLTTIDVGACAQVVGGLIAVWHCDALGYYSGFTANDPDQPPSDTSGGPTDNLTFLRGTQQSDNNGLVTFQTIFPGWYYERTIHIHVKVYTGGSVIHTGQFYFDEGLTQQVIAQDPYNTHQFQRWTNDQDDVYTGEGGDSSLLAVTLNNPNDITAGLTASITMGVQQGMFAAKR